MRLSGVSRLAKKKKEKDFNVVVNCTVPTVNSGSSNKCTQSKNLTIKGQISPN